MRWEGKKVLITGINGFIGLNLAKVLLRKNCNIIGIDNFSYVKPDKELKELSKNIEIIKADVSQKSSWEKLPSDIDFIFHFGAPSSVILFKKTPEKCFYETIWGMYHMLNFAKEYGIIKVVYPSSGSVYAGNKLPHSEQKYPKPLNLYASAKIACESLASTFQKYVKSTGLRIFAGYGPGEEKKGNFASVVCLFIRDIMNDKKPIVFGDGNQARDFIYIDDVINAIIKAAEVDYCGIINVGTGVATSFNKLIELINNILGKSIQPVYVPKEKGYVETLQADITLMKKLLEINPIPLEEGLKHFIEYLVGI